VYHNTNQPGGIDLETCSIYNEDDFNPAIISNVPDEIRTGFGTVSITENGLIAKTLTSGIDSFIIVTYDLKLDLHKKFGPYPAAFSISPVAMTSLGDSIFYVGAQKKLLKVNIISNEVHELSEFDILIGGDVEVVGDYIYVIGIIPEQELNTVLVKVDKNTGAYIEEVDAFPFRGDTIFYPGLATSWNNDCTNLQIIAPVGTQNIMDLAEPIDLWFNLYNTLGINFLREEFICLLSDVNTGSSYDAASWETHRKTCALRLDLDANNSQGRVGPHFRAWPTCVEEFPIADEDVNIDNRTGAPLDSLRINLKDANTAGRADRLGYDSFAGLEITSFGDTSLLAAPTPGMIPHDTIWANLLKSVRIVPALPLLGGRREVETWLHGGGLRADAARSFINVRPELPFAGRDTTFYVCRWVYTELMDALPDASPGGRWEPELITLPDGREVWRPDSLPYGEYRYITDFPSCVWDTAIVNVQLDPLVATTYPSNRDTIYLCEDETFLWDPGAPENVDFIIYLDFSTVNPRLIDTPGEYRAEVSYRFPPGERVTNCTEPITLVVLPVPEEQPSFSPTITLCAGDSVVLGGRTFTETGIYNFSTGDLACDTLYELDLEVLPPAERTVTASICPDSTFSFQGTPLTEPGNYEFMAPGPVCDSTIFVELDLLPGVAGDSSLIVSQICFGDTVEFAGRQF